MEPVVDAGRARLAVGTTSYLSCGAAADGGVLSDGDLTTPSPRRSTPLPLPLIAEPGLLFILHGRPYCYFRSDRRLSSVQAGRW